MSTEAAPPVGTQLGPYRLSAMVGEGGMSAVYKAEDPNTGQPYAIKVLKRQLASDPAFRERFFREWRYAQAVQHPNIVPVLDGGEQDNWLLLVMQYVEGTDLRRVLDAEGALPPERTISILSQVAGALDAIHAAGLLHRDVKPGNILLQPLSPDRAYLTDFGLGKNPQADAYALTAVGTFVGTVDYCPPEQILGEDIDARADIYSLGCVLYECLGGSPPFAGHRELDVLHAHIGDNPPSLSAKTGLPQAIDAVIERAMAKKPTDRYESASEMVAAAAAAIGAGAVAAARAPEEGPVLRVVEGPAAGRELKIPADGELVIGRAAGPPGDLAADPGLSRRHAMLRHADGKLTIEDLGSLNGTAVNGTPITMPKELSAGDRVTLGSSAIEIAEVPGTLEPPEELSEPVGARIKITLELDLENGMADLTTEGGPGLKVRREPDGSWRVELDRA